MRRSIRYKVNHIRLNTFKIYTNSTVLCNICISFTLHDPFYCGHFTRCKTMHLHISGLFQNETLMRFILTEMKKYWPMPIHRFITSMKILDGTYCNYVHSDYGIHRSVWRNTLVYLKPILLNIFFRHFVQTKPALVGESMMEILMPLHCRRS